MKRIFSLIVTIALLSANILNAQDSLAPVVKAEKLWESEKVFHVPESVFYDKEEGVLYVSSIDGSAVVKDENGFISRVATDGKVTELRWITGLHAPKGMGKYKGKLYVTDIDELVSIDVKKGEVLSRFPVEGSLFLNDIAIDKTGTVYVSDIQTNTIYRFTEGNIEKWFEHPDLVSPNGLLCHNGYLYIGCNDKILKVDQKSLAHTTVVMGTGGIDGLNIDDQGNFIISDWYGKVQCVSPGGEKTTLFDTSFEMINAADIYFESSNQTLYVPTFRDDRIMAYKIIY